MAQPFVIVRRYPYEEPDLTQLEWTVSNGAFVGTTDLYCDVDEIRTLGASLKQFPSRVGDEYRFEYGTDNPTHKCYRHFLLRAYTTDGVGHCALQFVINLNQSEPKEGRAMFSIESEPAAINRLGDLLGRFSQLSHLELYWNLTAGQLFQNYQSKSSR
jgi:hypothetical protein